MRRLSTQLYVMMVSVDFALGKRLSQDIFLGGPVRREMRARRPSTGWDFSMGEARKGRMEVRTMLLTRLCRLRWLFAAGAALATNLVLSKHAELLNPSFRRATRRSSSVYPLSLRQFTGSCRLCSRSPRETRCIGRTGAQYIRSPNRNPIGRYYGYAEGALARWRERPRASRDSSHSARDDQAKSARLGGRAAWIGARAASAAHQYASLAGARGDRRSLARFEEAKSSCMPLADAREELLPSPAFARSRV